MFYRDGRRRGTPCAHQSGCSSALPLLFAGQSLHHSPRLRRKLPFGNVHELPSDITKNRRLDRKAAGALLLPALSGRGIVDLCGLRPYQLAKPKIESPLNIFVNNGRATVIRRLRPVGSHPFLNLPMGEITVNVSTLHLLGCFNRLPSQ